MKFTKLEQFEPLMISACEAAIEKGIFYQDAFDKFVFDYMGGTNCNPHLAGIYSIEQGAALTTYYQMVKDITATIEASPRGYYAIVERVGDPSSYSSIVSDGTGEIAVGGKYNSYTFLPTGKSVIESMIAYEIYLCRKLIERRNSDEHEKNILNSYKFYVGQQFKNLQSDEHFPKYKFGTTTIVEILPDTQIRVNHTKRGTKNVLTGLVSPSLLSKMIGWAAGKKETKKEHLNVSLF